MCINLRLEASLSKLSSQVMDSHLLDGDAALTASAQLNFTGQVMIIQTPNFQSLRIYVVCKIHIPSKSKLEKY